MATTALNATGDAKPNKAERGGYVMLPKCRWYSYPFTQILVCTILGAATAVGHHFFCMHFNGRKVDTSPDPTLRITGQLVISVLGNGFSQLGSTVLSSTIATVFVQIFWATLSAENHSFETIDAIMKYRTSPFSPFSAPVWLKAWKLMLFASLGVAMSLVVTFAPGALQIATVQFGYSASCMVPVYNVSDGVSGIFDGSDWTPMPSVLRMTLMNLLTGRNVAPINPCGSCAYSVAFHAIGMNCSNAPESFPLPSMSVPGSSSVGIIWNATHDINKNGNTITVVTAGGYNEDVEAIVCHVFKATYEIRVQNSITQTNITVKNVTLYEPINSTSPGAIGAYIFSLALAEHLEGISAVDFNSFFPVSIDPMTSNHNIFYSALGSPGQIGSQTWNWQPSVRESLPYLAGNISLSLQANPLNIPPSPFSRQCQYSTDVYVYSWPHLWLTYGIALVIAIICSIFGFRAIAQNKRQEDLSFSRICASVLDYRSSVRTNTRRGPNTPSAPKNLVNGETQLRATLRETPNSPGKGYLIFQTA